MKMETVVSSPVAGKVGSISAEVGDSMRAGDLLIEIDVSGDAPVDEKH